MSVAVDPEDVEVNEDIIEVGRAQGRAVKGEDTLYVRGIFDGPADQRQLCAAVFDGHGGKAASAAALKTVGDRLMDQGPPFNDAPIANQHGTSKTSRAAWLAQDRPLGRRGELAWEPILSFRPILPRRSVVSLKPPTLHCL